MAIWFIFLYYIGRYMQYIISFKLKHAINTVFTFQHVVLAFFSQMSYWNAHNSSPGVPLIQQAQLFISFKDSEIFACLFLLMYQNPRHYIKHTIHVQTLAQALAK
jgi:hypothetical protein